MCRSLYSRRVAHNSPTKKDIELKLEVGTKHPSLITVSMFLNVLYYCIMYCINIWLCYMNKHTQTFMDGDLHTNHHPAWPISRPLPRPLNRSSQRGSCRGFGASPSWMVVKHVNMMNMGLRQTQWVLSDASLQPIKNKSLVNCQATKNDMILWGYKNASLVVLSAYYMSRKT